jgi:uncharacterized protein (TIGR03905 family)
VKSPRALSLLALKAAAKRSPSLPKPALSGNATSSELFLVVDWIQERIDMHEYSTTGTCSTRIHFELQDNKVYKVSFENGCNGNLKGIASLVDGMDADELVKRLKGIRCNKRDTSCPDQLAKAIAQAKQAG